MVKDYNLKLRDLRASNTLVGRGTGTSKDKDEVNKREVCEVKGECEIYTVDCCIRVLLSALFDFDFGDMLVLCLKRSTRKSVEIEKRSTSQKGSAP